MPRNHKTDPRLISNGEVMMLRHLCWLLPCCRINFAYACLRRLQILRHRVFATTERAREGSGWVDELSVDSFTEEEGIGVGGIVRRDASKVGDGLVVELWLRSEILVTQEAILMEVNVAMEGVWVGYPGRARG